MGFKPLRDSRPMSERPIEVQLEAHFFQLIRPLLTKKEQGRVMGAFREVLPSLLSGTLSVGIYAGDDPHTDEPHISWLPAFEQMRTGDRLYITQHNSKQELS